MKIGQFLAVCFCTALLLLAPATQSRADDSGDVQAAITAQLDAFRAGDGNAAYSHAAPNVTAMFPTPEIFMSMVQRGYDPVYRSSGVTFGGLQPNGSGFRQEVFLSDATGQSWIASYTLARQSDGSMKITGVQIRRGNDLSA